MLMSRKLLLVIMLFIELQDASKDSVLRCPNTTVEGKAGDTVILPCLTEDKMDIGIGLVVEWSFKDPTTGKYKTVHTYIQGQDFLHQQSDNFKNRTSLFVKKFPSGNFSLSLLVTTSHNGTYYCRVPGHICCTVTLKVLPKEEDSSGKHQDVTVSPVTPNNGTDGPTTNNWTIVVVAGVGVVAALIGLGIHLYRKPRNKPVDQNPNGEQIQMIVISDQDNPADDN